MDEAELSGWPGHYDDRLPLVVAGLDFDDVKVLSPDAMQVVIGVEDLTAIGSLVGEVVDALAVGNRLLELVRREVRRLQH